MNVVSFACEESMRFDMQLNNRIARASFSGFALTAQTELVAFIRTGRNGDINCFATRQRHATFTAERRFGERNRQGISYIRAARGRATALAATAHELRKNIFGTPKSGKRIFTSRTTTETTTIATS